ncbi:hypothetical protein OKW45_007137 [Paraburkholderia sp. WSM4175]
MCDRRQQEAGDDEKNVYADISTVEIPDAIVKENNCYNRNRAQAVYVFSKFPTWR